MVVSLGLHCLCGHRHTGTRIACLLCHDQRSPHMLSGTAHELCHACTSFVNTIRCRHCSSRHCLPHTATISTQSHSNGFCTASRTCTCVHAGLSTKVALYHHKTPLRLTAGGFKSHPYCITKRRRPLSKNLASISRLTQEGFKVYQCVGVYACHPGPRLAHLVLPARRHVAACKSHMAATTGSTSATAHHLGSRHP